MSTTKKQNPATAETMAVTWKTSMPSDNKKDEPLREGYHKDTTYECIPSEIIDFVKNS